MTSSRGRSSAGIERELGRMAEAIENGKQNDAKMNEAFEKLSDSLDAVRSGLSSLNQTMQSTATQVAAIGLERCGDRLDKIEGRIFSEDFESSTTRLSRLEDAAARHEALLADDKLPATMRTVNRWEKWIGRGWSFVGKIALAVIASGVIGGSLFGAASKIASHVTP